MKFICIKLIRFYQKYISPLKRPCCRFTPTCSAYALEAFEKRGFFMGMILSIWRILRCNPFCRSGYDPVPLSRKEKRERGCEPFVTADIELCDQNESREDDTPRGM